MWWMNTILARGYRNTLVNDELPEIDHALSSVVLRERILGVWSQSGELGLFLRTLLRSVILTVDRYRFALASFHLGQVPAPTRSGSCGLESLAHCVSICPAGADIVRYCLAQQSEFDQGRWLFCCCSGDRRAYRDCSKRSDTFLSCAVQGLKNNPNSPLCDQPPKILSLRTTEDKA